VQALSPSPKRFAQELIVRHGLKSGLDIGAGDSSLLTGPRSLGFHSTGIDVSEAAVENARKRNLHDRCICGNFMEERFPEPFDVVVISHVLEHFTRDDGLRVLQRIESLAKRLIYVETPHGFLEQPDVGGNLFQRHLSGWFPHDFEGRGYTVFGAGPRWLRGPMGKSRFLPEPLAQLVGRATQWRYFRAPRRAATIAAIKYIDESGNVRQL
jgi:SAM-dependent methyltransferase